MALHIWKRILLDRIHMTVEIGGSELYSFLLGQLLGMKSLQSELVPDGKIVVVKEDKKYRTRLSWYPTKSRMIADIEVGVTMAKHRYLKLGLYPSKFGAGEFERFQEKMALLLDAISYDRLFVDACVNYVELAADSMTHPLGRFIPVLDGCRCSEVYHVPGTGDKGTTYLGSESSALRFRIYDKKKQKADKGAPSLDVVHTRIEAVSKRVGLAPCDLLAMKNPFNRLWIADLDAARAKSLDPEWMEFLAQCLEVGSAAALAANPKRRKKYRAMLKSAAVPWWNPTHQWHGLPRALAVITPMESGSGACGIHVQDGIG